MDEFLGLSNSTWSIIGLNTAIFALDFWVWANCGNPFLIACAGFHVGLATHACITDRVFLAPSREQIRALKQYLSGGKKP